VIFLLDVLAVGVVCFGVLFFVALANVRSRPRPMHPGPPHSNVRVVRDERPKATG
jgi:hypothetical protein